jgi:hypothetical protein
MTFLLAAAGAAAGAAGIGGLTLATGATLGLAAGSTLAGSRAAKKAGETQAAAAEQASDLQREMFERQVELQAPFREAGVRALPELEAASRYTPFGMGQFQQDPGYAFRLSEGQKALDRQAAARGGLISGGALKAAQRFGQEMGSQEYTNAFNRYQTERQARLNPLQSLAGFGQTSVNQLGQAGQNYASNVGNLMTGGAAAQAAGQVGAANAITGGLGTYLNYSQNNALLEALQRNQNMQLVNTGGYSNVPAYMVRPPGT